MHKDPLRRYANLTSVIVPIIDDRRRTSMLKRQRVPGASLLRRYQPTRQEPMKLRNATRGSVASRLGRELPSVNRVWFPSLVHGSATKYRLSPITRYSDPLLAAHSRMQLPVGWFLSKSMRCQ